MKTGKATARPWSAKREPGKTNYRVYDGEMHIGELVLIVDSCNRPLGWVFCEINGSIWNKKKWLTARLCLRKAQDKALALAEGGKE